MNTTADSTHVVNGLSNTPVNGETTRTPLVRFTKPDLTEHNDYMPTEAEVSENIDQLEPPQFVIRAFNASGVQQREIQLKKYAPVYVGRALGCTIDLLEPSVSRRHCVFQYKDMILDAMGICVSGFMIYDLKSTHGTFLNGQRIPSMENIKLQHGDKLMLGQCAFVFMFIDLKIENQNITSSQPASGITARAASKETTEEQLAQPSSTTNMQPINAEINNEEPLMMKYIKLLNQLADLAKEYEEEGLPSVGNKPMLLRKFSAQHNKFINQAQKIAESLAQLGGDDPDIPENVACSVTPQASLLEDDLPLQQLLSQKSGEAKKERKRKNEDKVSKEKQTKRQRKNNVEVTPKKQTVTSPKTNKKTRGLKEKGSVTNIEEQITPVKDKRKSKNNSFSEDSQTSKSQSARAMKLTKAALKYISPTETIEISKERPGRGKKASVTKTKSKDSTASEIEIEVGAPQALQDPLAIPDTVQIEQNISGLKKTSKSNKKKNTQNDPKQRAGKRSIEPQTEVLSTPKKSPTKQKRQLEKKSDSENTKKQRGRHSKTENTPVKTSTTPKNNKKKTTPTKKREILSSIQPSPKRAAVVNSKERFSSNLSHLALPINQPFILLRKLDICNQNVNLLTWKQN